MIPRDRLISGLLDILLRDYEAATGVTIDVAVQTPSGSVRHLWSRARGLEHDLPRSALEPDRPVTVTPEPEPEPVLSVGESGVVRRRDAVRGPVLTRSDARVIKERIFQGQSNATLAGEFGCSTQHISNIKSGRCWRSA